jgi:hypothetical protein
MTPKTGKKPATQIHRFKLWFPRSKTKTAQRFLEIFDQLLPVVSIISRPVSVVAKSRTLSKTRKPMEFNIFGRTKK